jgi:hypothetical protein
MVEPTTITDQAVVPLPLGFTPEGVTETFIDPATIHLVEQTIPGGRELLAHLLYYATVDPRTTMQRSFFHATGEANDEAIVLISSVEALAKSPNSPFRAPDACARRLVALEALKVIRRKVHRAFTEIRIPLGKRSIHVPSLLTALWEMHETYKDDKVKQLARKVAKQLKTGEFLTYAASTCMRVDQELVPVVGVLDSILQARGIKEEASTLAEACNLIAGLLLPQKYGQVGEKVGEFLAALSKGNRSSAKKAGESVAQSGEFVEGALGDQVRASDQVGESVVTNSPEFAGAKRKRRACRVKTGEFQHLFATNSPEFEPFGRVAETMGESVAGVSISDHSSSSITSKRTESLNDSGTNEKAKQGEAFPSVYKDTRPPQEIGRDAKKYADLLDGEGNYRWIGNLIRCIQNHPSYIRHLAVIDTLYHTAFPDWRGRPKAPGAWFCKACDCFNAPGAKIPHEVRLWAETGLPYHEIDEALQRGQQTPMDLPLPLMSSDHDEELPGHGSGQDSGSQQEAITPALAGEQVSVHTSRPCTGLRTRMNASQAQELRQRIEREGAYYGISAKVQRGEQGSSVVVTTWDGVEEAHVNEAEWDRYFADVTSCLQERRRNDGRF